MVEFLSPNKGKANGPNYLAWAGTMHITMGAWYGPMSTVFNDKVPYVEQDLNADDVPQACDSNMEDLSAANLDAIRFSVITAHAKKKIELRDDLPNFFKNIILKISVASQLLIEADGEWVAAKAAENPNALVVIV